MASFGQSVLFGQPSDDPNVNFGYLQSAIQSAQLNPQNTQMQRQVAYWQEVVARQAQANSMAQASLAQAAAAQAAAAQAAAAQAAAHAPAPAPAGALAPQAPMQVPPLFSTGVAGPMGPGVHYGSSEQGSTPFITPAAARASTPRAPSVRGRASGSASSRFASAPGRRHRTRSADRHEGEASDTEAIPRGLGTRIVSAESSLRRNAAEMAQLVAQLAQADQNFRALQDRLQAFEQQDQ